MRGYLSPKVGDAAVNAVAELSEQGLFLFARGTIAILLVLILLVLSFGSGRRMLGMEFSTLSWLKLRGRTESLRGSSSRGEVDWSTPEL